MSDKEIKDKKNKPVKGTKTQKDTDGIVHDMGVWHRIKSQFLPQEDSAPVITESFEDMLNEGRAKAAKPRLLKDPKKAQEKAQEKIKAHTADKTKQRDHQPTLDSGMDGRTQKRLKQGKLAIDGILDLHGMTQAQAQAAVVAFVEKSYLS